MTNAELLADILASIRIRSSGRTRYEGQPPYEDEMLLDEIERLQSALTQSALEQAGLVEALEMIAGRRQCLDSLMGNVDIAIAALGLLVRHGASNVRP